jgi:hypothetical protein
MPDITPLALKIDFESEGFPAGGPVTNGHRVLDTTWDELLWAAVTVGRPNRHYVFRHGDASVYEAIFRWSLIRMALEQRGQTAHWLRRTAAAKTLDPSEKGAVGYFLGMTLCKLFSARLLDAPWLMHLDVFRPQLNAVLMGRSRPDLVGRTGSNDWVVLESKGRVSAPNMDVKNKAKIQAQRVISINGKPPSFCIGGIAYFRNDVLQFFWRDPAADPYKPKNPFDIKLENEHWRFYYLPLFDLVRSQPPIYKEMLSTPILMPVKGLDIEVGIHPQMLELLAKGLWGDAVRSDLKDKNEPAQSGYQADGIRVVAGHSWLIPFMEFEKQSQ